MAGETDEGLCDQLDDELDWRIANDPAPSPAWHYTDEPGLRGILQGREMWLTERRHLNDPTEAEHGEDVVEDEVERLADELPADDIGTVALREFLGLHDSSKLTARSQIFIASFSHFGDRLSQWREYGAKGAGYSIGFSALPSPTTDDNSADVGLSTANLEYDETTFRATVRRRFRAMLDDFRVYQRVHGQKHELALYLRFVALEQRLAAGLALTTKHSSFFEETECRMFAVPMHEDRPGVVHKRTRPTGEEISFVKIALAEPAERIAVDRIVVGPLGERAARRRVAVDLLESLGYPNPESMVVESTCVLK